MEDDQESKRVHGAKASLPQCDQGLLAGVTVVPSTPSPHRDGGASLPGTVPLSPVSTTDSTRVVNALRIKNSQRFGFVL